MRPANHLRGASPPASTCFACFASLQVHGITNYLVGAMDKETGQVGAGRTAWALVAQPGCWPQPEEEGSAAKAVATWCQQGASAQGCQAAGTTGTPSTCPTLAPPPPPFCRPLRSAA